MILYPAIDILGGRTVRLLQGDYERETSYDAEPADAARRWAGDGAKILHVVDLDGARTGRPVNVEAVARIAEAVSCPIQVGGGIRDRSSLEEVLAAGASRVVLGTAALRDPAFLGSALESHGEALVVSIDARAGEVSLDGWTEGGGRRATEVAAELGRLGVRRFLFTSIDVDGTMEGPAIDELNDVAAATDAGLLASGGVGNLSDLELLARVAAPNVEGAIVGRALYERRFSVAEGIAALDG